MSSTDTSAPEQFINAAEERVHTYRSLLRTSLRLRRHVRRLLNSYGLTGAQYGLLTRIPPEGIALTQLAATAWADPGNTSGVVDRLVREGLVQRTRSTQDRRVVMISLSDAGRELLAKLTPLYTQAVSDLMQGLSLQEVAALQTLLEKLNAAIGSTNEVEAVDISISKGED